MTVCAAVTLLQGRLEERVGGCPQPDNSCSWLGSKEKGETKCQMVEDRQQATSH